ncbi:SDR family oxidoreductase [Cocleimonas sp. KMM 6892]|uniref:SDR family NAD(P)-dependent oxidoreductase n=1 Tax=unclassified Cocleimonas TaxID=2639732 RepID=UPI002DBF51FA|nr:MULTISPECIES: SDR family oxidoreductase [unclassified Cocleimonas]MEB8433804.1 SDR family oxidoreductase [Cocleimonas sp. KMM 6892]MEC4716615.1 SDR family oxidoreductase [Cocleimonas sp. KMM 6895]MEC4746230.1 SDR family oxidoreductase [Cocleimonas sp. KMM 6896]
MKSYNNKVVVVTGGATGIGNSIANKFAHEGAKVIICARREDRLQQAVKEMTDKGLDAHYKVCDVSELDDVKALADYVWNNFGQVDVLVNNAGVSGVPQPIIDSSKEAFQQVLDVNIFGMLNGIWAFGKRLIEQGSPALILNVNSEVGLYIPSPMVGSYAASKYAARAICETLRLEMPEYIQVSCIYPGIVQTELGGSKALTQVGMPADEFVEIIWPQIENREFHIVSHPWAKDYFWETAEELTKAFDRYAPHFEGDEKYDSKLLAKQAFKS